MLAIKSYGKQNVGVMMAADSSKPLRGSRVFVEGLLSYESDDSAAHSNLPRLIYGGSDFQVRKPDSSSKDNIYVV